MKTKTCLGLALAIVAFPFFAVGEPLSKPEDLELIRTLLDHNEASRARIKSLRVVQEWETVSNQPVHPQTFYDPVKKQNFTIGGLPGVPDAPRTTKYRVTFVQRGGVYRLDLQSAMSFEGTDFRNESRRQVIVADTFASSVNGRPNVQVNRTEYESLAKMPRRTREIYFGYVPITPATLGFDVGRSTIREQLALHPDQINWSVEESDGGDNGCFIVSKVSKRIGTWRYTIDPNRGFLITRRNLTSPDGAEKIDWRVLEAKQFGDVWLATSVEETDKLNDTSMKFRVASLEVNPKVLDSEFDFESMEYDRDSAQMVLERDGQAPQYMRHVDGKWVPFDFNN